MSPDVPTDGARPRRLLRAVGVVAAGGVLLAGCGVAGTDFQPGAAAEVGDRTLEEGTVDRYATYFCTALDDGAFGEVGPVARISLRQGVAGNLVRKLAAEQLAAEYGVEPGDYYRQVREQAAAAFTEVGSEQAREALVDVQSASAYVNEVALAVGTELLRQEGQEDASPEQRQQRGNEAYQQWLADREVDINPALGIALDQQGAWQPADGSTSVAVSSAATLALDDGVDDAGQPDPQYAAYVAGLPASQRCG